MWEFLIFVLGSVKGACSFMPFFHLKPIFSRDLASFTFIYFYRKTKDGNFYCIVFLTPTTFYKKYNSLGGFPFYSETVVTQKLLV